MISRFCLVYILSVTSRIVMSKQVKKQVSVLALGRSKRIDISKFKGRVYIHLNDFMKQKNFTFNVDELSQFFALKDKIERRVQRVSLELKKLELKELKKEKKEKKRLVSSDDDDDDNCGLEEKGKKIRKIEVISSSDNEGMSD